MTSVHLQIVFLAISDLLNTSTYGREDHTAPICGRHSDSIAARGIHARFVVSVRDAVAIYRPYRYTDYRRL